MCVAPYRAAPTGGWDEHFPGAKCLCAAGRHGSGDWVPLLGEDLGGPGRYRPVAGGAATRVLVRPRGLALPAVPHGQFFRRDRRTLVWLRDGGRPPAGASGGVSGAGRSGRIHVRRFDQSDPACALLSKFRHRSRCFDRAGTCPCGGAAPHSFGDGPVFGRWMLPVPDGTGAGPALAGVGFERSLCQRAGRGGVNLLTGDANDLPGVGLAASGDVWQRALDPA